MADKTLREQLEENYPDIQQEVVDNSEETVEEVVEEPTEEKQVVDPEEPAKVVDEEPSIPAPQSWKPENKADWEKLPKNIQAEITRRESDIHKAMTKHDGELRFGREMKEVYEPFSSTLQKYGAQPAALMKDLLGTVIALKEGDQATKIQIMRNIAQSYGVDMRGLLTQEQENPFSMIQREISAIKETANPNKILELLQSKQEDDRIHEEIRAFAEANEHFDEVKDYMKMILESGRVGSLQEAYDAACWAHPSIRSTLMRQQQAAAKHKAEIAQKKSAAVSIKGSPSAISGNPNPPQRSLREELEENLSSIRNSKF